MHELPEELSKQRLVRSEGSVLGVNGSVITARVPHAALGDLCYIERRDGSQLPAQVVSFQESIIKLAPFEHVLAVGPGACVVNTHRPVSIPLGENMCGRILDAFGNPFVTPEQCSAGNCYYETVLRSAPNPLERQPIEHVLETGIRSVDALCTLGRGQRIGLIAPAAAGKSTLLGMLARNTQVDVNVIALIGERGREVNEFIQTCLGSEGLKKSVIVVSTSDEPAQRRFLAALTATTIAEHFRDQGKHVLLLTDSLTRMARAIRDVSLSAGELPIRHGYTASVYTELPQLLERAGTARSGSITAVYTLLSTAEHEVDPLAEEVKSILDGHLVLSPELANQGVRPAIDYSCSISRLTAKLLDQEERKKVRTLINAISRLKKDKDMLVFGGIPDPELGAILELESEIKSFLAQDVDTCGKIENSKQALQKLYERLRDAAIRAQKATEKDDNELLENSPATETEAQLSIPAYHKLSQQTHPDRFL